MLIVIGNALLVPMVPAGLAQGSDWRTRILCGLIVEIGFLSILWRLREDGGRMTIGSMVFAALFTGIAIFVWAICSDLMRSGAPAWPLIANIVLFVGTLYLLGWELAEDVQTAAGALLWRLGDLRLTPTELRSPSYVSGTDGTSGLSMLEAAAFVWMYIVCFFAGIFHWLGEAAPRRCVIAGAAQCSTYVSGAFGLSADHAMSITRALYYSVVMVTLLDANSITPHSVIAEALVGLEALFGTFFALVIVGVIAGAYFQR